MRKKISVEKLIDLLDDSQEIKSSRWKFGRTVTYLLHDNDENYTVTLNVHYEDGIQICGKEIEVERVVPVSKTVTIWVPEDEKK